LPHPADPRLRPERPAPTLLARWRRSSAASRTGRMTITPTEPAALRISSPPGSTRPPELSLMTGLLVFWAARTFCGLIETGGSVGKVLDGLKVGGDGRRMLTAQGRSGRAARRNGLSFPSSLFGPAALADSAFSICSEQGAERFYTDLEMDSPPHGARIFHREWAPETAATHTAVTHCGRTGEGGGNRGTTEAMANLAEPFRAGRALRSGAEDDPRMGRRPRASRTARSRNCRAPPASRC